MPADQQASGTGGDNRPIRIPLVTSVVNRGQSPTIDGRLINAYAEKISQDETWIYKRPGLQLYSSTTPAIGRGIFNWLGDIYAVWGGNLYKNNVLIGNVASAGMYTFSSALGGTPRLFLHNQFNAYYWSSTDGLVPVAGGFPANVVAGQAFLDATTYVMTPQAVIQGSGINDLTTWPALNNLIAQIEPDQGVALAKQLVYVVAFKQWSTEMFYDAGNATGSPLGTVQGQKLNLGCRHPNTVVDLGGSLLWVSQIRNGGMSVMLMDQLSAQPVSTPNIERLLQATDWTQAVLAWAAKIDGHMFYGLTLTSINITLVFDLKQQLWYEWTDPNGNYFPIASGTFVDSRCLLQGQADGNIYVLNTQQPTDNGATITTDIYTPPWDAGTRKRKVIGRMRLIGDKTPGNMLQVRTSDDDFQSFSNFRSVDMNTKDPFLTACGTFRRRVWHIRQAMPVGGRLLVAIEPELELGAA